MVGVTVLAPRIRVFVAGPVRVYREALAEALADDEVFDVVGTGIDARDVIKRFPVPAPDLVLLDASAPGSKEAIRTLVRIAEGARVVAVGVRDDGSDLVACAEAGVSGFVACDEPLADFVATLRSVADGEVAMSSKAAETLLHRVAALGTLRAGRPPIDELTPREKEVLSLLETGLSNKQIGLELSIELPTVKQHVHHILAKLSVSRRGEAVALMRGTV